MCSWMDHPDKFPEHLRPSESGVIIRLGRKWHGRDVIRAVPTGEKIPPETLEWLMAYSRQTGLPLLFSEHVFREGRFITKKRFGYGPVDFVREVELRVGPEDIFKP